MATNERRSVLFVGVTQGREQCSIGHALSAVRAHVALLQQPIKLEFRFEPSLASAIDHFWTHPEFDVLVAVDNHVSYREGWVLDNALGQPDKLVVAAIYPLPGVLDWERVRARAGDADEPNSSKGLRYSADVGPDSTFVDDGRYAVVPSARLACVTIKRPALEEIARRHPDVVHESGLLVHAESVEGGKRRTRDETFCALWGGPIYVDLEHPASSFGSNVFAGTVALRQQLR